MKIEINILTGEIIHSGLCHDLLQHRVLFCGTIDRIHSLNSTIELPSLEIFEKYLKDFLDSKDESFLKELINRIEGNYFVIIQGSEKFYAFCDRFGIKRIYYSIHKDSLIISDDIFNEFKKLSISTQKLLTFLAFRFIPGRQTLFDGIFRLMPGDYLAIDIKRNEISIESTDIHPKQNNFEYEDELSTKEEMHELFRNAIYLRTRELKNEKFLVPLSGGLDSRYILLTLLELYETNRILAYSFGAPGSFDLEIARRLSTSAGVKCLYFPLNKSMYNEEELIKNCYDTNGQINFITEAPFSVFKEIRQYGKTVLSGYVGDTVMGAKARIVNINDKKEILFKDSIVRNRNFFNKLIDDEMVNDSFFYECDASELLSDFERWFFINHFSKYSNYCVFKNNLELDYINPFIDHLFYDFVLNFPIELRLNRYLYINWLMVHFVQFVSLPVKMYYSASLNSRDFKKKISKFLYLFHKHVLHHDKYLNYLDFSKMNSLISSSLIKDWTFRGILPGHLTQELIENKYNYLLVLNCKCIDILSNNFDVEIITSKNF